MGDASYITEAFYLGQYLLGRNAVLPRNEFLFWEKKARAYLDQLTFNRIQRDRGLIDKHLNEIGGCLCELAEFLYLNEGSENKVSEAIPGRSVAYQKGTERAICRRWLDETGLTYRGWGRAT